MQNTARFKIANFRPGPLVIVVLGLAMAGCGISTKGLIPDPPISPSRQIDKRVTIMPVLGGRGSTFGREAYITNEQYGDALRQTIEESGIFSAVTEADQADVKLHSEIITITTEGGISPHYAIVVQYWVTDAATGRELWRKGINTRHTVNWDEAFAGATRIILAVEGATKKNLTRLVNALAASEL